MKISDIIETLERIQGSMGDLDCIAMKLDHGAEVTDGLSIGTGLGLDGELYVLIMPTETALKIEAIQGHELSKELS